MPRLAPVLALSLALIAPCARATPPIPTGTASDVDELQVQAKIRCLSAKRDPSKPSPRVVSSYPAPGAVVRPGVLVVRLTFDRRMTCDGLIGDAPQLANPCPSDRQRMSISFDLRTLRVLCATAPDRAYGFGLAVERVNQFQSLEGRRAEPFSLEFRTSSGPRVKTIAEALELDAQAAGSHKR